MGRSRSTAAGDSRRPPTERLFTAPFIALGVADLAYFTAVGVAIFALPLYVTGPVGGDEIGAGIAFGVFAVSALVLRPIAGRLADVYGRRPLLLGGALLAAACLALMPTADALLPVIALRLLAGVAEAAFFVAGFAALADLAPPNRLGEALSYNSLGLYLGFALGPVLGELLVRTWGFAAAWIGAAVLAAVAAALSLIIGETRAERAADEPRHPIIHREAVPISIGFLTSLIATGGFLAFASLYAAQVGLGQLSTGLLVYGGVVVVCRIAFARVPDRLPSLSLGAASLSVIGLGLGLTAIWQAPAGFLIGVAVMAVGVAFSTPAFFAAIFSTATPSQRGAASGTASAAVDLGLGLGPIALGFIAGPFGIPWAFAVGATIAFAGAAWTLLLTRRRRGLPAAS
ncbi:MFS transporter [Agromyces sp. NPDC049794]|uniref:MFS transporter n=1 Tax=unclassified Agromyces TaxID=2639701 RepID=UPI0033E034B6